MEYRSINEAEICSIMCVCVYAKTIIASRMGPVCQDRRKLQPVVQDKPNTEDSVPDILWKAAMLGAGVGCMLPRHLWSFIVIHGPYMGVHDYSWPFLVLHVASWSFYSWSIHILERNHTRAAWLDCWNLFAFYQRPSGFQVSLLDVVRCCKILSSIGTEPQIVLCVYLFSLFHRKCWVHFAVLSVSSLCTDEQSVADVAKSKTELVSHIYNYVRP